MEVIHVESDAVELVVLDLRHICNAQGFGRLHGQ